MSNFIMYQSDNKYQFVTDLYVKEYFAHFSRIQNENKCIRSTLNVEEEIQLSQAFVINSF